MIIVVSTIVEIIACVFDALLAGYFITKFNNSKFFSVKTLIFGVTYSTFNITNLFLIYFSPYSSIINTFLLLLFSISLTESGVIKRIIAPTIFEGALILGNTIVLVLISLIVDAEFSQIANDRGLIKIFVILFCKLFLCMVLSLILRFTAKQREFTYKDVFLLILFPITLFLELTIMVKIALTYPVGEIYGYFVAAVFALFLTYIGIYYMVYRIVKNNKIALEKEFYRQMLSFEEKRYDDMNESLEQMRKIKHDITHQFCSVKAKLDKQDWDGASKELDKIMCNVNSTGTIIQTENKILDYIVNTKLGKLNGVTILVSGDITDLKLIDDLDLSIILGNIIDNAVEAVTGMENPKIELSFSRKDYYLNIVCGNSIRSSVLKENPDLITSKPNKISHGYGIKSVRGIVERYNGQLRFFESDDDFFVHIMIPVILA